MTRSKPLSAIAPSHHRLCVWDAVPIVPVIPVVLPSLAYGARHVPHLVRHASIAAALHIVFIVAHISRWLPWRSRQHTLDHWRLLSAVSSTSWRMSLACACVLQRIPPAARAVVGAIVSKACVVWLLAVHRAARVVVTCKWAARQRSNAALALLQRTRT